MTDRTDSPDRDVLHWHLERGHGRGLELLRVADPADAADAVEAICCRETRWDADAEDRTFYFAKALAIADDRALEERVLDRWERELVWSYRGPWSEVGLVLAGRGNPRAMELIEAESRRDALAFGPGAPALPEGLTDAAEWLDAIREDPRLRVGAGLRLATVTKPDDLPKLRRALADRECRHLQEAVAVAYSRTADDDAREWLLDTLSFEDSERTFWWWQALSGQRPSTRSRDAARRALADADTRTADLAWILRVLERNRQPGDEALLAGGVRRGLVEGAEDAVSVGIAAFARAFDPAFAPVTVQVLGASAFGHNRRDALALAVEHGIPIASRDVEALLEDADDDCRRAALAIVDADSAPRLRALAADDADDPSFRAAVAERMRELDVD